jgi:hypothetical protein
MEVHDGFIIGVYNYCDRWCEYCPFTGRCRSFADRQEIDFELASGKTVEEALAARRLRVESSLPGIEFDLDETEDTDDDDADDGERPAAALQVSAAHCELERRAHDYSLRVWRYFHGRDEGEPPVRRPGSPTPLSIVAHFAILIGPKVYRALWGLSLEIDGRDDANGSAKVALLGIERSHAAWLDLVVGGHVSDGDAAPFIADLVWLGDALEDVFPHARAFVRPAFDEPEAVARLEAEEKQRAQGS